ncbi:hypothetical protein SLS58_010840 [Diplodia intermedia]|uniref:Zn(2)-C6 fungal-type domain-containing protein n=1 Tax=Diplodia intermedia TaxID=856260 RepID=A0ABR3T410_9PEZI
MANSFGWTPSRNQDISFEDGLALIDAFYEGPNRDALPGTMMPPSISPPLPDATQAAGLAQTIDEARTAAAIAQLPDSPVDRSITNKQTKIHVPILSAGTGARPSSVAKENKNPSSKALKKKATDSPGSASAPRSVKKLRCVRCVKQHGACDLDTKHPCSRCAKAKVAPEECVPRDYSAKVPAAD